MAKINVTGEAVVITSAAKLSDLKNIAKYRPEALKLMGGKDGKELLFTVGVDEKSSGGINSNGAIFGRASRGEGFAEITKLMPGIEGDVKEAIVEEMGGALLKLNALEAQLPAVVNEIAADKAKVMEAITVG